MHHHPVILRVWGLSGGAAFLADNYVATYDLNAVPKPAYYNPYGDLVLSGKWGGSLTLTTERRRAHQFRNAHDALLAWRTVSSAVPLRPDGKPNRPLTAFSVEIEDWKNVAQAKH